MFKRRQYKRREPHFDKKSSKGGLDGPYQWSALKSNSLHCMLEQFILLFIMKIVQICTAYISVDKYSK